MTHLKVLVVVCVFLLLGHAPPTQAQRQTGDALLERARHAIGVAANPVTSMRLTGRHWTSQGVSYEREGNRVIDLELGIEILLLRPDHYVRVQTHQPERGSAVLWWGVSNGHPLAGMDTPAGRQPGQRRTLSEDHAAIAAAEASKLLLGLVAVAGDYGLRARALRDGAVDVEGRHGFRATVVFDPATGLPVRVITNERLAVHTPGTYARHGPGGSVGGTGRYDGPPIEVVTSFEDRRDVQGLLLPFLIRTTAAGIVMNEHRLDRIELNVPVSASDFTHWRAKD